MAETSLTPGRLWRQMTPERRLAAARAFWLNDEATDDQIQAVALIAQQKKFRPKTVVALDIDRKARHLASLTLLPDALAGRVLIAYHLADQRPMMAAFLDALGIAHQNGLIQDDAVVPDAQKLGPAAQELAARYPVADVRLYLSTLLCQDPQTWGGLRAVLDSLEAAASPTAPGSGA